MDSNGSVSNGWNKLPYLRQVGLIVIFFFGILLCIEAVQSSTAPRYRPLLQNLSVVEASRAVDVLEYYDIEYAVDIKQSILYVEVTQQDMARLRLAKEGFSVEFSGINSDNLVEEQESLLKRCGLLIDLSDKFYKDYRFLQIVEKLLAIFSVYLFIMFVMKPMVTGLVKL